MIDKTLIEKTSSWPFVEAKRLLKERKNSLEKKGQIILFPPYWTHPHFTAELKNRTYRYTINSWLHEDISITNNQYVTPKASK